jgi:hypothetical protein
MKIWRKIMKSTMKLLLIVVIFCGTAMAGGEMVGGGFAPTPDTPEAETTKVSDAMLIYVSKWVISFLR